MNIYLYVNIYLFIFTGRLEAREQIQREIQYQKINKIKIKNKHSKKVRKEHCVVVIWNFVGNN